MDQSLLELLLDSLGFVILQVTPSLLALGLALLPAMPGHSPALPIRLGPLDLVLVFDFSCFGNGEVEPFFPLLVSLLALLFFGNAIFVVLLPDEVLFGLIPHSLLTVGSLYGVLVLNHGIDLSGFDPGQVVELSPFVGVFGVRNILIHIPEILDG